MTRLLLRRARLVGMFVRPVHVPARPLLLHRLRRAHREAPRATPRRVVRDDRFQSIADVPGDRVHAALGVVVDEVIASDPRADLAALRAPLLELAPLRRGVYRGLVPLRSPSGLERLRSRRRRRVRVHELSRRRRRGRRPSRAREKVPRRGLGTGRFRHRPLAVQLVPVRVVDVKDLPAHHRARRAAPSGVGSATRCDDARDAGRRDAPPRRRESRNTSEFGSPRPVVDPLPRASAR